MLDREADELWASTVLGNKQGKRLDTVSVDNEKNLNMLVIAG